MPSSRPNTIPTVIHLVRQLKPKSILDVGVGFGKWGHLFREYTDIREAEKDPARYQRQNWQVTIDGIEGHPPYLTEMHRYLYNEIHVGDACKLITQLPRYDLIFMGDIIEHVEKKTGLQLVENAVIQANKAVIIITPRYETGQGDLCGNELERHHSLWGPRDFRHFARATVKTIDRATLLIVIVKQGIAAPICAPQVPPKAADVLRFRVAKEEIMQFIAPTEAFILVDDEQIRSDLPHRRSIPFLEKDGQYWGPPPNDETAIREVERLRKAGAKYIVFTWPTFWWIQYYVGFYKHITATYRCVLKNDRLEIFALPAAPAAP
jgi:hypothetical protein